MTSLVSVLIGVFLNVLLFLCTRQCKYGWSDQLCSEVASRDLELR